MHRCSTCGQPWDDDRARDNELTCTRRCAGRLVPVPPPALPTLDGCDPDRLPYPVALTAARLSAAVRGSGDVIKTLFLLKDCFEATVKFLGAILLTGYLRGPARTPERTEGLLRSLVRPSLGSWVGDVVRPLSLWLVGGRTAPECLAAGLFAAAPAKPGGKPTESPRLQQYKEFVAYRNDALGHGAQRSDAAYEADLARWLPVVRGLLDGVAGLAPWRLCLVTAPGRCQDWTGPTPGTATEPVGFPASTVGHFALHGPGDPLDLAPFLSFLPDAQSESRLHYYDSLHRYQAAKKEATVLEYDRGERHRRPEPVAGMEEAYTAELVARAFDRHRGRMAVIEGRVAHFGELIEAHAAIVGRGTAIDRVRRFLADNDRGLLVIEGQPGTGKTALTAHLVETVFGHHAPRPVHFFFRRTAGIVDPEVCVRSLYASLLEAHGITEAAGPPDGPGGVATRLTNLLAREVAPRLQPGRPQLVLIDALDEAAGDGFRCVPEELPPGVFVVATTRPVPDRAGLARRPHVHWLDLDAPDLAPENRRDGLEYVRRELAGGGLPDETLAEVARVGAGNFLVLRLLCRQAGAALRPEHVADFLRCLSTDEDRHRLGFIYAEFWQRLTHRCPREDVALLCGVAGVLVAARGPLTAGTVCGALGLRAADWDYALRHLAEYLTAVAPDGGGDGETFYRVYHESFADYLRSLPGVDRTRAAGLLADHCWREYRGGAEGMSGYARAHLPAHLAEAGRWADLLAALADPKLDYLTRWVEKGEADHGLACLHVLVGHLAGGHGRDRATAAGLATAAARIHGRRGQYREAQHWLNQAVAWTNWWRGRRARAVAVHELGSLALLRGDLDGAAAAYRRALRLCEWGIPPYPDEASANLVALATVAHVRGRPADTLPPAKRAWRAAAMAGDVPHQVAAERLVGTALLYDGRFAEAETWLTRAQDRCARHDVRLEAVRVQVARGWLEFVRARVGGRLPAAAVPWFDRATTEAAKVESVYAALEARIGLAWCALAGGDTAAAADHLARAAGRLAPGWLGWQHAGVHIGQAAVLHQRGDFAAALDRYREVAAFCRERTIFPWAVRGLVGAGAAHWHRSEPGPAGDVWREAMEIAARCSRTRVTMTERAIDACRADPGVAPW